jgi:hypothetical protein
MRSYRYEKSVPVVSEPSEPQDLFSKVRANARANVPAPAPAAAQPPGSRPSAGQMADAPFFCRRCGGYAQFSGYAYPLCGQCRVELSSRPFPPGVWAFLAAFAIVFLLALLRLPGAVAAGVTFERGQRAEARGDFNTAADRYIAVIRRFPEATSVLVRGAVVSAEAGRAKEGHALLNRLRGRTLSNADIPALDRAERKIWKTLSAERAESAK